MWTKITEDKATWPPTDESLVLLYTRDGNVYAGECSVSKWGLLLSWVLDPDDGSTISVGAAATHWMPLPQPPAE